MFYAIFGKRTLDVVLCTLILPIAVPACLILGCLVAAFLGRPVLFYQDRPGLNGEIFYLSKFRSMTNERDTKGNLLPNERRITTFGKILRSTSLDELPSLINVLRGEMSLVGPRPLRSHYLKFYSKEQSRRHSVKPGITGLAQVSGRANLNWDEKLAMDIEYVDSYSLTLDIKIIFMTALQVLLRDSTTPENSEFEIPFDVYVKNKSDKTT
jgi:lipopolysaccharide/colanic/teichoic acid biosynthesis glycosyltransferase